jgi:serine/threonine-protein kinase RsbW
LGSGFAQTPLEFIIMAALLNLQIKNSLEALHSAIAVVSRWLGDRNTSEEVKHFACLALEELVTNSIKYGYEDSDEHVIEVSLRLSKAELVLVFVDRGRPFNPLEAPDPPLDLPIEERQVGGLGLYLLRKMSDRMTYVRKAGENRVTLHKFINTQTAG